MISSNNLIRSGTEPAERAAHLPTLHAETRQYYQALLAGLGWPMKSPEQGLQALGITSSSRGEGVSTVASQLAVAAAAVSPRRVVLLTLENLATLRGTVAAPGWRTDQAHHASLDHLEHASGVDGPVPNLQWFRVGTGKASLDPEHFAEVVSKLKADHDLVIVDLPAVMADGQVPSYASLLDGIVLVVEAERVAWEVADRAKTILMRSGANLLGVVLNKHRQHMPRWLRSAF